MSEFAADAMVGIFDSETRAARELICMANLEAGCETAAFRLGRYTGWSVSESRMRRIASEEGKRVADWREQGESEPIDPPAPVECHEPSTAAEASAPIDADSTPSRDIAVTQDLPPTPPLSPVAQAFRQAEGDVEFYLDGVSVNTTEGWREMRIALWMKRPRCESAAPWEWEFRKLNEATARAVSIQLADADEVCENWRPWAASLGITNYADIHAMADGAEWIWNRITQEFPGAQQLLDNFHAIEHMADAVKILFPDKAGAITAWTKVASSRLISEGWNGVCYWIHRLREELGCTEEAVQVTDAMLNYFRKHFARLNYAERLKEGKSIGSGPVEGAAKQMVKRRLKQTGARWTATNATRNATLCSCAYVGDWSLYWRQPCLSLAV